LLPLPDLSRGFLDAEALCLVSSVPLPFCRWWQNGNGKTFPAIPFSRATATAATERKNGKTERWKLYIGIIYQLCVKLIKNTGTHAQEL